MSDITLLLTEPERLQQGAVLSSAQHIGTAPVGETTTSPVQIGPDGLRGPRMESDDAYLSTDAVEMLSVFNNERHHSTSSGTANIVYVRTTEGVTFLARPLGSAPNDSGDAGQTSSDDEAPWSDTSEVESSCSSNEAAQGSVSNEKDGLKQYKDFACLRNEHCLACNESFEEASSKKLACAEGHAAHSICWLRWRRSQHERGVYFTCMMCRKSVEPHPLLLLWIEDEERVLEEQALMGF